LVEPLPLPLPFHELYCPSSMLGFGVASLSNVAALPAIPVGLINLVRTSLGRFGLGSVVISWRGALVSHAFRARQSLG
jgi:hypothetical protein